jgi:hypothetical protein
MSNLAKFTEEVLDFNDEVEKDLVKLTKNIASDGIKGVVNKSPVLTGTFCVNNRVGIGQPNPRVRYIPGRGTPMPKALVRAEAIGNARPVIMAIKAYDIVYITNYTPYGWNLEWGSSAQAPAGMYRVTYAELQAKYRSTRGI